MKKIIVIMRESFPTNEILTDKNIKEKYVLNPYDEYALFQAKKLKETEDVEILCYFISQRESQYGLRTALGLGADKGFFIFCKNWSISEIAKYLATEIQKEEYDAIFMGIREVNNDREELPSRLAGALHVALYSHILSVRYQGKYVALQERESAINTLEIHRRGIFAFRKNVYEPEYPSIDSILSIQKKEIRVSEVVREEREVETKVRYQSVERAQKVYKKVDFKEGSKILLDYLQEWKLIDEGGRE